MSLDRFHPAVKAWFESAFAEPTPAQIDAWEAIKRGEHALISAPTGSGKTLAAFLSAIDDLVRENVERGLEDKTYVLYVSPLKALSNDIQKNLQVPLQGIAERLEHDGDLFTLEPPGADTRRAGEIRALVRTGDTPAGERDKMRKKPPHILVTTPESLYILLTSESGRRMLGTVRSVIVDEIHALTGNKRGAHLSLSLERLQGLVQQTTGEALVRIGLSATQHPIKKVARFLVGERGQPCTIINSGHVRERDLAVEVPASPLQAVMANEVWAEVHRRLAELAMEHRTTLVFVNNRRLAERTARHLGEIIGDDNVTSHHGSLAREHRLKAEQRLKHGHLRVMVATASLELGIDIGEIDLVCQIGSPRSIAALLQRVGRSGHGVGRLPKGRLFPTSRDDLVECAALLDAVRRGEMDILHVPVAPLDVLAQQIIAEVAGREWDEDALYEQLTAAYPYAELGREQFDRILAMLADGFTTRRGRRSAYLYRDVVNKKLRARKGARLIAITNAGAIPDQFDYDVIMEPDGQFVGTLNEDFAFESLPGDIFQLGNTSYRIQRIERSVVRVEDARGLPPNIPFWFGEAPGRTDELSIAVSRLRGELADVLREQGLDSTIERLVKTLKLSGQAAVQLAEYLSASHYALQTLPTRERIVFERFFDEAGDQHIVIHSPYGSRVNRAWGLALRKKFCRKFNFELQAAALEDSIVISLGATHSFPLEEVRHYVKAQQVRHVVTQAMLQAPLFMTRWRWVTSIALAIQRNRSGKRVPAQFQRMDAEDLVAVVFPDQIACQDNVVGEREIPDHPLVNQTIADCLNDAMDIEGLERLLTEFENGRVEIHCRDLAGPSPLAQEILTARPYAFLDDAPAEERRTQAVAARGFMDPADAAQLARLDPEAIEQVRAQAWPNAGTPDELHDALQLAGVIREDETGGGDGELLQWRELLDRLIGEKRATILNVDGTRYWVAAEKLALCRAVWPKGNADYAIEPAGPASEKPWDTDQALVELLRGRLQCIGPVTETALAEQLQVDVSAVRVALAQLQNEGFAMQGRFSPDAVENDIEWCERGLLARIHRYTMQRLREAVKPVTAADYMRFLFEWHGITEPPAGENALVSALHKLEGFSAAAAGWESDILPARIAQYSGADLDRLCTAGRFLWVRLYPGTTGGKRQTPVRSTPITLLSRAHSTDWFATAGEPDTPPKLSANANTVLEALRRHGASFYADLVQHTGLLRTQVEDALGELAAAGIVSSDNFTGLRALIAPASKKPSKARLIRRGMLVNSLDNAGRWSIIRTGAESNSGQTTKTESTRFSIPYETLEYVAQTLLHRYGVVFRKVLLREPQLPPWRELLYVYRRMEARGEIRGGRFVDGFGGEQFSLPEAVGLLRRQRNNLTGELTALSATDPLNLAGIILPGERIPAQAGTRIVFRNGLPVAVQSGKDLRFVGELSSEEAWRARNMLARRINPTGYTNRSTGLRQ